MTQYVFKHLLIDQRLVKKEIRHQPESGIKKGKRKRKCFLCFQRRFRLKPEQIVL
jgi:hypothetical protein